MFLYASTLLFFLAFIYGFIASRFFNGWGLLITKHERLKYSAEHLSWTLLAFGLLIDMWTGSWQRETFITKNIGYFIGSLGLPFSFYILGTFLFPIIKNGESIDLREFFLSHKKAIFFMLGVVIFVNSITAISMEQELVHIENLFRLIALLLAAAAVYAKKTFMERVILIVGWLTLILHIFVQPNIE